MRSFKLPIWSLMVAVVAVGLAIAALRYPSELVTSAVFTLTVMLLCVAFIVAVSTNGRGRAIWLSFALVGGLYLGFTFRPDSSTVSFETPIFLPTTLVSVLLDHLKPHILPPPILDSRFTPAEDYISFKSTTPANQLAVTIVIGQRDLDYLSVGHCLATLLIGFLASLTTLLVTAFRKGRETV